MPPWPPDIRALRQCENLIASVDLNTRSRAPARKDDEVLRMPLEDVKMPNRLCSGVSFIQRRRALAARPQPGSSPTRHAAFPARYSNRILSPAKEDAGELQYCTAMPDREGPAIMVFEEQNKTRAMPRWPVLGCASGRFAGRVNC